MSDANVTDRQAKWFASVRDNMERETGKTLAAWTAVARTCPETGHRARLRWLKEQHGLLQNRASLVLDEAFGGGDGWGDAQKLIDALWVDAGSRAILQEIEAALAEFPDTVRTARKGYTAWSRKVQFAALRPTRDGGAMLGVAVSPVTPGRLVAPKNESWSERLTGRAALAVPADVDAEIKEWLQVAWTAACKTKSVIPE